MPPPLKIGGALLTLFALYAEQSLSNARASVRPSVCPLVPPLITPTLLYYASAASVASKPFYWQHNFAGLDMSSAWRTTGYPNRSSSDSCRQANARSVVLL